MSWLESVHKIKHLFFYYDVTEPGSNMRDLLLCYANVLPWHYLAIVLITQITNQSSVLGAKYLLIA